MLNEVVSVPLKNEVVEQPSHSWSERLHMVRSFFVKRSEFIVGFVTGSVFVLSSCRYRHRYLF